jgi:pimeloyl-ACP methyl ester carboxylesterase
MRLTCPDTANQKIAMGSKPLAIMLHLLQWLEAVKLHRAIFIGHSMGSAIALTLALRHPQHVIGLVLVGAGARLRVHPELLNYASDPTTFYKSTDLLVNCSFGACASPRLVELASMRLEGTRHTVLYGDLQACNQFDVMGQLETIKQKTLVMVGEQDVMTPVRYAQYLASSMPEARLSIIPNAGHMVMLEQPHLVAEGVQSFLNDISYRPGEGS